MSDWKQKRFWQEAKALAVDDGFGVTLDTRALKTPAKAALVVPTQGLAAQIALEWDAQEEVINPLSMPFTRAANAAIDKVAVQHTEVAELIAAYGETDLLCYRADTPQTLIDRQSKTWNPLLDWASDTFHARLEVAAGVMHIPQKAECIAALRAQVDALTSFELTAFHDLVSLSGSLIIGLAAIHGHAPIEDLWRASRVDEDWQEQQWGEDEEATALAQVKHQAFLDANRFYLLLQN